VKRPVGTRWFIVLFLIILFFGWASTGVMIYIRIFMVVSLMILGSYLWNLISLRGIQVTRRSRSLRTSVGKVFDERYDIKNVSRWVCLWLEIENLSQIPQKSGSRVLTSIGAMQQRSFTARAWITKRGAYSLGPTLLSSGDPFGLFVSSRLDPARNTLVVLPMTVDIPYFPEPEGILPGGKEVHQKTMDATPHATGVREYVPGDPIKRVHWPSTAKRQRFMVKTYEQDPQAEVWFFLDSDKNAQYSLPDGESEGREDYLNVNKRFQIKLPNDTYEYAISATASLAKYFLQQKRPVGLVSSGSQFTVIPSERGERQLGKLLETLAFLKADGDLPISGCVRLHAKYLPMGSGGYIVTPTLNKDLITAVEYLDHRHLFPMVVYIAPESIGGPSGDVEIERGLELRSIPVFKIMCGENLASQLAQIKGIYKRTWFSG